ncbi:hypothetical protein M0811_12531 [Anaeramoeba ignava]|uniref:Uncharacterized protein n=1 Tax=Anaeramoeba ignava TaxID=1746090 RepID=A0A9Q0LBF8_ANAIG|nr:hypothetical protein M0811_12531 [Anaeramoeba ignava]
MEILFAFEWLSNITKKLVTPQQNTAKIIQNLCLAMNKISKLISIQEIKNHKKNIEELIDLLNKASKTNRDQLKKENQNNLNHFFTFTQFASDKEIEVIQSLESSLSNLHDFMIKSQIMQESNIQQKMYLQNKISQILLKKKKKFSIRIISYQKNHKKNKNQGNIQISPNQFTIQNKTRNEKHQFNYEKAIHFFLDKTNLSNLMIRIDSDLSFLIEMKNSRQRDILVNLYLIFYQQKSVEKEKHGKKSNQENNISLVRSSIHSSMPEIHSKMASNSISNPNLKTNKYQSIFDHKLKRETLQNETSFIPLILTYQLECSGIQNPHFNPILLNSIGSEQGKVEVVFNRNHFNIFNKNISISRKYSIYSHIEYPFFGGKDIIFQIDEKYFVSLRFSSFEETVSFGLQLEILRKRSNQFIKNWFSNENLYETKKCLIKTNESKIESGSIVVSPDLIYIITYDSYNQMQNEDENPKEKNAKPCVFPLQYTQLMEFYIDDKNKGNESNELMIKISKDFSIALVFSSSKKAEDTRQMLEFNQRQFLLYLDAEDYFFSKIEEKENKFISTISQEGIIMENQTLVFKLDSLLVLNQFGIFAKYHLPNREELPHKNTDSDVKIRFQKLGNFSELHFQFENSSIKNNFVQTMKVFDSEKSIQQILAAFPQIIKYGSSYPIQVTLQHHTKFVKGILKIKPQQRKVVILITKGNMERDFNLTQIKPLVDYTRNCEVFFVFDEEKIFIRFDSEENRILFMKRFGKLKKIFSLMDSVSMPPKEAGDKLVDFSIQSKLPNLSEEKSQQLAFQQIPGLDLPRKFFRIRMFDPNEKKPLPKVFQIIHSGTIIEVDDLDTKKRSFIEVEKDCILHSEYFVENLNVLEWINSSQRYYFEFFEIEDKKAFMLCLKNSRQMLQLKEFHVNLVTKTQVVLPTKLRLEPAYLHYHFRRNQRKVSYQALEIFFSPLEKRSLTLKFFSSKYQHEMNIECQNSTQKNLLIQKILDQKNKRSKSYLEPKDEFSSQFKLVLVHFIEFRDPKPKITIPSSFSIQIFANIANSEKQNASIELNDTFFSISFEKFPHSYFEFLYSSNCLLFIHPKKPNLFLIRTKLSKFSRLFKISFPEEAQKDKFIQSFAEIIRSKNLVSSFEKNAHKYQEMEDNLIEINEIENKNQENTHNTNTQSETFGIEMEEVEAEQDSSQKNDEYQNDSQNKIFKSNFITKKYQIKGHVIFHQHKIIICKVQNKIVKQFRFSDPSLYLIQKEEMIILRSEATKIAFELIDPQILTQFIHFFNQIRSNFFLARVLRSSCNKILNKVFLLVDDISLVIATPKEESTFLIENLVFRFSNLKPLLKLKLNEKEEVYFQFKSLLNIENFQNQLKASKK